MFFSDECSFSLRGALNKQNCKICGKKCSYAVYESSQNTQSLMVGCTLSKRKVIGPYVVCDGTATGDRYKRVLQYYLFPKLTNYPSNVIFEHSGDSFLYSFSVKQYLDFKLSKS